jgi:cadmium resistance protein CadD (predicted permease)
MTMNKAFGAVVIIGLVLLLLLAIISFSGATLPGVNPALEAWTKWFASIVAIMVSARAFWAAAAWLRVKAGLNA